MLGWFFLLTTLISFSALADMHIPKTSTSISIDGDLSDAGWNAARVSHLLYSYKLNPQSLFFCRLE